MSTDEQFWNPSPFPKAVWPGGVSPIEVLGRWHRERVGWLTPAGKAELLPEDESDVRLSICRDCELFESQKEICLGCGCSLRPKAYLKHSVCPRNKWPIRESETTVEKIDPEKAREYLALRGPWHLDASHPWYHKPTPEATALYARLMSKGEWIASRADVITFTNGALVDGQHRLLAVIEFGGEVEMCVTRNNDIYQKETTIPSKKCQGKGFNMLPNLTAGNAEHWGAVVRMAARGVRLNNW